ncbi:MAG: sulfotransferase [Alphaproteobacteria bacterium]|nr:sulfotransferase [Alphaproteobacteria bacterium]MBU1525507.1 sulfotransferase [Alphaproteobacteria bacterium]MBU2117936.1 sulfotransferase [Alphaproteobacteria bacterium]MBU2350909.1 sulfotransferase [Alphaproteobacteria bacterium]MBU2383076.1 sulfotransferase [Alphaproteobacteria bacterium]
MTDTIQTLDGAQAVNAAVQAFQARDRDACAALLARAVKANPPLGAKWGSVSRMAATIGEATLALIASRRTLEAGPTAETLLAHAQLLQQTGRTEEGRDQAAALVRQRPNDPAALHFLATAQVQLGQAEEAQANLRRIMTLPTVAFGAENAWHVLADMKTFTADDPDVAAMEALLERIGTAPERRDGRTVLLYALGKAYDDQGRLDAAFAAFDEAARLQKVSSAYDADKADRYVDAVVGGWDRAFMDGLPKSDCDSDRPIFVLGLPRSGTTLVEQILVSHSAVKDGAEANLFRPAAMAIPGYTPAEVTAALPGPNGAALPGRVARSYLHLLDERFGKDGRVVDKTLNQTRMLGLIHQCLPKAKFVWLRRHPAGIAWSCFRTRFARGVDWTRSLEDIGRHFRGEDRLWAHWTKVLPPETLLTVPYEALVADPDTWMRRILEHVGLPWEDQVRDFHKTDRAVTTASFAQVRKPLYSKSATAWKRYEDKLKPFFDAYEGRR